MSIRPWSPEFQPFPLLSNRHLQTVLGHSLRLPVRLESATEIVPLADGDRLALEVSTPPGWRRHHPTVVLVHGLGGCHESTYLVRLATKLLRAGIRAARLNLRGCGSGAGLARGLYHSGRSEDLREVLEAFRGRCPESPRSVVGFSLGGNVALKLAGELAERGPELLERVIAVCPPADLARCAAMISRPENRPYDRWFVRHLRRLVRDRHRRFPDLGPVNLPRRLTLVGFDDLYTAPQSGFAGARDYYARASSAPLIPWIRVPCRILFAEDDPFIDATVLDGVDLPPNVTVLKTPRGGHMGFLADPRAGRRIRWLDHWVLAMLRSDGESSVTAGGAPLGLALSETDDEKKGC